MIERFNRIGFYWALPGAALQVLGVALHITRGLWVPANADTSLDLTLVCLGFLLLVMGLANYAKAKGRSTAWCLFAFLGFPGWILSLVILGSLRDLAADGNRVAG